MAEVPASARPPRLPAPSQQGPPMASAAAAAPLAFCRSLVLADNTRSSSVVATASSRRPRGLLLEISTSIGDPSSDGSRCSVSRQRNASFASPQSCRTSSSSSLRPGLDTASRSLVARERWTDALPSEMRLPSIHSKRAPVSILLTLA
eukprot:scaffold550_cov238-Pinguiococcus_pyrenoidosus.AAC.2